MCLSFPITELCLLKRRSDAFLISAFLTDEEQALTGGHSVLNAASPVFHYLLHIQYTAARLDSTALFLCKICIPSCAPLSNIYPPRAPVRYGAMERINEIYHVFKRSVQNYKNTPRGKVRFDTVQCRCTQQLQLTSNNLLVISKI